MQLGKRELFQVFQGLGFKTRRKALYIHQWVTPQFQNVRALELASFDKAIR